MGKKSIPRNEMISTLLPLHEQQIEIELITHKQLRISNKDNRAQIPSHYLK
jgi:hypothetical protein